MIKFVVKSKTDDGFLLGLGVSEGNLQLLKTGRPIVIDLTTLGLGPGEILLFYGETEADMVETLKAQGFDLPTGTEPFEEKQ